MPTRFDLAYAALAPIALPYAAWRRWRQGKYRESGPGMLGRRLPAGEEARRFERGGLWIHAVSVGEVAAARALIPGLREAFPDLAPVLSTVTETGQAAARRDVPDVAHTYFPLDFSGNVRRFLAAYRPRVVVILEAELWPNFISLARESGARVFQANGRLSDRSFPRYRLAAPVLRPLFASFSGFCVQTEADAERYAALGIPRERIRATGNCKFDLAIATPTAEERIAERAALGIAADAPVVVAGSTHPGEEEIVLEAFRELRAGVPGARLILAPRHPERFDEAHRTIAGRGFAVVRASVLAGDSATARDREEAARADVVLLDRMGVLARTYGLGDVAIVAGSFGAVGGHNLLEAAAHSIPVVFGPNMRSQREIDHLFRAAGAGTRVQADELGTALEALLLDPALRRSEGERARSVLDNNRGAARRCVEAIREWNLAADSS